MASLRLETRTYKGAEKSRWIVRWHDEKGTHRQKTFEKKADGAKLLKILKSGAMSSALGKHFTVQDACERYLRVCEMRHREGDRMERTTLAGLWNVVDKHVVPFIGTTRLRDLTPMMVDDYVGRLRNHKANPRSAHVINASINLLRNSITEAQRLQLIDRNVLKDVPPRKPPIKKADVKIPSKEEIKRLLEKSSSDECLILELAIFTGMRAGELCGLGWSAIDFEKCTVRVHQSVTSLKEIKKPKTKSGIRTIPLPRSLVQKLREFRLRSGNRVFVKGSGEPVKDLIFLTRSRNGGFVPMTSGRVHAFYWKKVCVKAGLVDANMYPTMHFHALRHVAASLFIESGLPPKRIQQIMGHASITMTFDTYGHLFPDDGAAARASEGIAAQFGR